MATFFTSDTHFGHKNIIALSNRPFSDCDSMDAALISNWNARVKPSDTVWHLGDFTWAKGDAAESYLKRLNGKINLVWGNHDSEVVRGWQRWQSSQFGTEIHLDGHRITLCHYAMRVWNKAHKGALMLYGHSHDSLPGNTQSLDVGVDSWGMRPSLLTRSWRGWRRFRTTPAKTITLPQRQSHRNRSPKTAEFRRLIRRVECSIQRQLFLFFPLAG